MRCHVWISVWSIKWLATVRCPWRPRSAPSPWSTGLSCGLNPLWSTSQNLSLFFSGIAVIPEGSAVASPTHIN
ncbi:hypothetical protein PF008_g29231 [Phytophthora fragariae]|uniref:Secreted protein n=1 Tax=Phytophthora fragariae TaxID=53985 RepID=A0A6G0Q9V0_9STRA|nr:hypothetical protein PF008_g29231 [Phytophthora fragariae]